MLKISDYPKEKYSAYFEIVEDDSGFTARVYDRKTGKVVEHKSKSHPESWIKTEMAKRKI